MGHQDLTRHLQQYDVPAPSYTPYGTTNRNWATSQGLSMDEQHLYHHILSGTHEYESPQLQHHENDLNQGSYSSFSGEGLQNQAQFISYINEDVNHEHHNPAQTHQMHSVGTSEAQSTQQGVVKTNKYLDDFPPRNGFTKLALENTRPFLQEAYNRPVNKVNAEKFFDSQLHEWLFKTDLCWELKGVQVKEHPITLIVSQNDILVGVINARKNLDLKNYKTRFAHLIEAIRIYYDMAGLINLNGSFKLDLNDLESPMEWLKNILFQQNGCHPPLLGRMDLTILPYGSKRLVLKRLRDSTANAIHSSQLFDPAQLLISKYLIKALIKSDIHETALFLLGRWYLHIAKNNRRGESCPDFWAKMHAAANQRKLAT